MAYSIDFRRKVFEIKERDSLSIGETAHRFGISGSGVFRWSERPEPCRTRNKPAAEIDMSALSPDAEHHPDACRQERAGRSGCSRRGICEALKRLKITRKKNVLPSEGR